MAQAAHPHWRLFCTVLACMTGVGCSACETEQPTLFLSVSIEARDQSVLQTGLRERIDTLLSNQLPFIGVQLDIFAGDTISVVLAAPTGHGVQGAAIPEFSRITIPAQLALTWPREHLERVLRHELAHIALARAVSFRALPLWFDEGYAEWSSGQFDCMAQSELRSTVRARLHNMADLLQIGATAAPASGAATRAAYASTFEFIFYTSGVDGVQGLFDDIRAHGFAASYERLRSHGLDFDEQWSKFVAQRYGDTRGSMGPCTPSF